MANTHLNRAFSSSSTNTKATWSVWVKRGKLGSSQFLFHSRDAENNTLRTYFAFESDDTLKFYAYNSSGSFTTKLQTNRKFRDTSGWYHIVFRVDTTQGNVSHRVRLYVNNEEETSFSDSDYPSSGEALRTVSSVFTRWGKNYSDYSYFDGLLSHVHFIEGEDRTPDYFGETDSVTGEWKIKTHPTGFTYGSNGYCILKDGNSLTDQSGNSNNFTLASGTLTKTEDCPSNLFATWNSLWSQSNGNVGDVTFSNGNLTTITTSNYRTTPANLGMKTGKYYWEVKRNEDSGSNDLHGGIMSELATPANTATWIGNAANGWVNAGDGGDKYTGGTNGGSTGATASNAGDIMMFAYDADNGKLYFGVNGSWGNSANPATGANPHYDSLDTTLFYFPCVSTGSDCSANFGNGYFGTTYVSSAGTNASGIGIFEYDVPAGFTALSTKGINE